MALAIDKIEALAPDQASMSAAVKLKASSWPLLAVDASATFAWGECQGSGSTPYRVCIQLSDLGYKCTCPSRKFPCKHSLSLMLQFSKSPQGFATGSVPEWVSDWSGRRRSPTEKKEDAAKAKVSINEAMVVEPEKPRDAASEARAAAQRDRTRAQREAAILAGLDELDRWIGDALNRGLASFMGEAAERCRTLAQRITDAKAPALASALDALPGQIMEQPEHQRQAALIEALGYFHLLAQAYRRQDKLPGSLRHDVRRLVGWTIERQSLLDEPTALRVNAKWTVIACQSEIQPDKMRRTETWLIGENGSETLAAALFDFVPVAASSNSLPHFPGERFDAELVYYPSAAPLRAIIAQRSNQADGRFLPDTAFNLTDVLNRMDEMRIHQPWLRQWPVSICRPGISRDDRTGLWLREGDACIPLSPRCFEEAVSLTGTTVNKLAGLWDGRHLTPTAAETAWGLWFKS